MDNHSLQVELRLLANEKNLPDRTTTGWKMHRPHCQLPRSLCDSHAPLPATFSEVHPTVRTQPDDIDLYGTIPILHDVEVPADAFLHIEQRQRLATQTLKAFATESLPLRRDDLL